MSQQAASPAQTIGLYLNPAGQRRAHFQALSGEQFGKLFIADGTEQAALLLAQQPVDLLVIDLELFDRVFDLAALGQVIGQRGGAPTLVLCPYSSAGWLPELMAFGQIDYAITPLLDASLQQLVAAQLSAITVPEIPATELRAMMATGAQLQQAIAEADDFGKMADQACQALTSFPGVVQAALFHMPAAGELRLEAQHSPIGLNVARILQGSERLLQSPLRSSFPGLLAAVSGEMALLDEPGKAGEPELAVSLADNRVGMVLGLPLPPTRAGLPCGALCLMFDSARTFTREEFAWFGVVAQLAGFGMRMAELARENEQLRGRVSHLATTDALTGMFNRRHGEHLLELEARRARRYNLPLAVISFDIDRFKAINDQFGHPVGDAVIRTVANTTQSMLRNSDLLVRSGGEEFLVIVPHTSAIDALKIAEKLRSTIAEADIPGCDRVTVSLAVGQLADQESPDGLIVRVDAALFRAKRAGRNCVELAMQ